MGKNKVRAVLKIVRRAALLVLFGMLYNGLLDFDLENMRYASVLGRIGVAWAIAAIIYLALTLSISKILRIIEKRMNLVSKPLPSSN